MALFAAVKPVRFVPPLAVGKVPVTPVVSGSPVLEARLPVVVCNVPLVGSVRAVVFVAVRVTEKAPTVASVEPSPKVSVAFVAGAVMATLFMLVAEATPIVGVVRVGLVARTTLPDPVEAFPSAVTVPLVGSVSAVAPVDVKVMEFAPLVASVDPSAKVNVAPVAGAVIVTLLTLVAAATPSVGVVSVGLVARTMLPEPVDVLPRTVTVPPVAGNVNVWLSAAAASVIVLLSVRVLLAAGANVA